jgi:hypothetical protein
MPSRFRVAPEATRAHSPLSPGLRGLGLWVREVEPPGRGAVVGRHAVGLDAGSGQAACHDGSAIHISTLPRVASKRMTVLFLAWLAMARGPTMGGQLKNCARLLSMLAVAWWGIAQAAGTSRKGNSDVLVELTTGKYHVGQVWKFTPRPGEEEATLTVVRVESTPTRDIIIVHVSIDGVHLKSPRAPGGFTDKIQHLPFSESAIANNVTKLIRETKTLPSFEDGYREWRQAFDAGKGGFFTGTVAEVIQFVETAMNR